MSTGNLKKKEIPKIEGKTQRIVCYGCSMLCDDVYVELSDDGQIIKTINSCFRGNEVLKTIESERRFKTPVQKKMGLMMNLSMDEAIEYVNQEIKQSKSIKFYGIGALSNGQQISVIRLIKKMLDSGIDVHIDECSNLIELSGKYGFNLTSLGQAVNNGDVFLFLNTDPTHSHPKLTGKIVFSRGMFRSTGKEVKRLILMESLESDINKLKDIIIDTSNLTNEYVLSHIRQLLENSDPKKIDFEGIDSIDLVELKNYLENAEYGVLVTTIPLDCSTANTHLEYISRLLATLNKASKGRFSLLPLTLLSNQNAEYHSILSFFEKDEIERLKNVNSENDELAIIFGGEYLRDEFKVQEFEYPEIKKILFDNLPSEVSKRAKIVIPFKIPGIEQSDIAVRLDGIAIELQKWTESPEDVWSIEKIFDRLFTSS